eukprot:3391244-Prymnesium_polylepis.1
MHDLRPSSEEGRARSRDVAPTQSDAIAAAGAPQLVSPSCEALQALQTEGDTAVGRLREAEGHQPVPWRAAIYLNFQP